MKKFFYTVFLFAIIVGSFWAGSWYSKQGALKVDPAVVDSQHLASDDATDNETWSTAPDTVKISPQKQQLIGVRVGVVEKKPVVHMLRVLGRVEADETRVYRINAFVDGWITEVHYNTVGSLVKKGEVLATFYSPAFLDAQQSYLYALGAVDRLELGKRLELGRKELPADIALDQLSVLRFIDVLRGLGMSDSQLEEVGRTREIALSIRIVSPADGFIMARNVSPEERFLKGDELYRIADLSRVWILADVFEQEVQYFEPGKRATVYLPYQKKTYQASVSEVLPIFDPVTRTLKVRLETDNPGFALRPDMFVDVELPIELPAALTIPVDAVLNSGRGKTVFVDRGHGSFEPRKVEIGWRMGERVEIIRGLMPGERIVLAGNFFLDSESRLQAVARGIYGPLSLDPVCGMEVDELRANASGLTSVYQGKTYYFCAAACKKEFDAAPAEFTDESAEKLENSGSNLHPGAGHD